MIIRSIHTDKCGYRTCPNTPMVYRRTACGLVAYCKVHARQAAVFDLNEPAGPATPSLGSPAGSLSPEAA